MTERMPPTPEEVRQLRRSLLEKMLDRAASDPRWKRQLLDDPDAAMRAASFPEAQTIEEMRQRVEASQAAEVVGHVPIGRPASTICSESLFDCTEFCCRFTW